MRRLQVRQVEQLDEMRNRPDGERVADIRKALQDTMDLNAQVFRTGDSLNEALADIRELQKRYRNASVQDKGKLFNTDLLEAIELGFLLDIAEVTVVAAINRKESRGGHYREDFPNRDDANYMLHTMAYRRPPEASDQAEGHVEGYFDHVEEFDGYKVVLGSKPVVQTRYEPMERKY